MIPKSGYRFSDKIMRILYLIVLLIRRSPGRMGGLAGVLKNAAR